MSAALIDPRPPPPVRVTKPRTQPLRVCAREGCGTVFVANSRHWRFCNHVCAGNGTPHEQKLIEKARRYWALGFSTLWIAMLLSTPDRIISKNVVVGIAHRNPGFPPRPSPIRRKAVV